MKKISESLPDNGLSKSFARKLFRLKIPFLISDLLFRIQFCNLKLISNFQASSALNLLLVLSRDDCTLPQLRLSQLTGLPSSLLCHLRAVSEALSPEKTPPIGSQPSITNSATQPPIKKKEKHLQD